MVGGNLDLDRSLDDIIKKNKSRPAKASGKVTLSRSTVSKGGRGGSVGRAGNGRVEVKTSNKTNTNTQRNSNGRGGGRVGGSLPSLSNAINRRIGGGGNHSNGGDGGNINSRLNRTGAGGAITKRVGPIASIKRGRGGNIIVSSSATAATKKQHVNEESTRDNRQKTNNIDPKSLVITKSISPRIAKLKNTPSGETLVIQSSVPRQQQQQQQQTQQPPPSPSPAQNQQSTQQPNYHPQQQQQTQNGFNAGYQNNVPAYNNNQSYQQPQSVNTISSRGQQKNIVLICNLDPRATAEDVGEACSMFGPILSCDILLDPMGRPLNEAEIEFLYPSSAEDCVAKLDNGMADGRILRARLQTTPTLPVVPRYSSRTVIASARVSPGAFDNNSQSQYSQNNYSNNNSHSSHHHTQRHQPQYHHQQRRY